jgi:hypothetical protein
MKHRLAAPLFAVLVLALAAFTGSALAGGGQGNGGGSSNGNSANAPGHQTTQAPAAAPAAAPTATAAPAKPAKADHSAKSSKQSSTSASNPATGGSNSNGVKPSNTTKHDTYAKASSDQTKKYGNGKTAGQIATQAGYGDATLHGPGNSQPHKVLCGGHEVDVHALKNKGSKCGTSQPAVVTPEAKQDESSAATCTMVTRTVTERVLVSSTTKVRGKSADHANAHARKHGDKAQQVWQTVTKTLSVPTGANCESTQPTVVSTQVVSTSTVTPAATVTPATASATVTPATSATTAGSVLGTQATLTPATSSSTATPAAAGGVKGAVVALKPTKTKPAGGVLGTTTRLGGKVAATRLPFTGLPLWIFALVAAGLIGVGLTMRRAAANRI